VRAYCPHQLLPLRPPHQHCCVSPLRHPLTQGAPPRAAARRQPPCRPPLSFSIHSVASRWLWLRIACSIPGTVLQSSQFLLRWRWRRGEERGGCDLHHKRIRIRIRIESVKGINYKLCTHVRPRIQTLAPYPSFRSSFGACARWRLRVCTLPTRDFPAGVSAPRCRILDSLDMDVEGCSMFALHLLQ